MRKRIQYYVNTGGKWIPDRNGGGKNFIRFNDRKAANRYFKAKPGRQIDVRGTDRRGCRVLYCWKYWDVGRIVVQSRNKKAALP